MDNKQLLKLAQLIDLREKQYQDATDFILDLITPTILAAVYDLFECSHDDISWYEVDVVHDMLMLVAIVSYKEDKKLPKVVQATAYTTEDDSNESISEHVFRIGIPLELVFSPPREIIEYLLNADHYNQLVYDAGQKGVDVTSNAEENTKVELSKSAISEFDSSKLTPEQLQQLIAFQTIHKGSKH